MNSFKNYDRPPSLKYCGHFSGLNVFIKDREPKQFATEHQVRTKHFWGAQGKIIKGRHRLCFYWLSIDVSLTINCQRCKNLVHFLSQQPLRKTVSGQKFWSVYVSLTFLVSELICCLPNELFNISTTVDLSEENFRFGNGCLFAIKWQVGKRCNEGGSKVPWFIAPRFWIRSAPTKVCTRAASL